MDYNDLSDPIKTARFALSESLDSLTRTDFPATIASYYSYEIDKNQSTNAEKKNWITEFSSELVSGSLKTLNNDNLSSVSKKLGYIIWLLPERVQVVVINEYEKELGTVAKLSHNGVLTEENAHNMYQSVADGNVDVMTLISVRSEKYAKRKTDIAVQPLKVPVEPLLKIENLNTLLPSKSSSSPSELVNLADRLEAMLPEFQKVNPQTKLLLAPIEENSTITGIKFHLENGNQILFSSSTELPYIKLKTESVFQVRNENFIENPQNPVEQEIKFSQSPKLFIAITESKFIDSFVTNEKNLKKENSSLEKKLAKYKM